MPAYSCIFISICRPVQATFETFGGLLMGAAWDSLRIGMGKRSRRRGDYLLVLQKPPIKAGTTWRDRDFVLWRLSDAGPGAR